MKDRPLPDPDAIILNEPTPFEPHEVFFSRTDERGVIAYGNDIFQRVSGYDWGELSGAPHKIIRHPDMPKAVFWLLWETIKAGQPIGAYVKNRSKDGRYYWVFAVVTPISNGYLSVRLQPTSDFLPIVEKVYAEVREAERTQGLSPSDSAALLMGQINGLGFKDYASFMSQAFSKEAASRAAIMGTSDPAVGREFQQMFKSLSRIHEACERVAGMFEGIKTTPVNMGVVAAQLGQSALPLTVISQIFSSTLEEIRTEISAFLERGQLVAGDIHKALFVKNARRIQAEVVARFVESEDAGNAAEMGYLAELEQQYIRIGLRKTLDDMGVFQRTCARLIRTMAGLSVTSVIGHIESARIGEQGGGIDDIMSQLAKFQTLARDELGVIQEEAEKLKVSLERERQASGSGRRGYRRAS